jgi:hypothetical protein
MARAERMLGELEAFLGEHPELKEVGMFDQSGRADLRMDLIGAISASQPRMQSFAEIKTFRKWFDETKTALALAKRARSQPKPRLGSKGRITRSLSLGRLPVDPSGKPSKTVPKTPKM